MHLFGRKEKNRPKSQPPPQRQGQAVNPRQNRASINVPTNPDTRPLPEWWIEQYDPHYSRFFYVDTRTERRQWEHPDDLPPPPPSPSAPAASQSLPNYRQYPSASSSNYQQQPYNAYPPQQGPYQASYATNQPNVVYATQPASRRNRFGLGGLAGGALGGAALGFLAGDLVGGMGRGGYGYGYGGYGGGYEGGWGGGGWNDGWGGGGFGGGGFDGGGFNGGGFDGGFGGGGFDGGCGGGGF